MSKYYCGVGSRQTPPDVLNKMTDIAFYLAKNNWVLRSGGAKGADQAFEKGSNMVRKTRSQIFLPGETPKWTNVFTDYFHPNPTALTDYARKLMNRNALQILGRDGNKPVDCVICWTRDGKFTGGTGQALRIANYYNIPIFNLKNGDSNLKEWLK